MFKISSLQYDLYSYLATSWLSVIGDNKYDLVKIFDAVTCKSKIQNDIPIRIFEKTYPIKLKLARKACSTE